MDVTGSDDSSEQSSPGYILPRIIGDFCERCLSIVQDLHGAEKDEDSLRFQHHDTMEKYKLAAEHGCWFCSTSWDRFTADEKRVLLSDIEKGTYCTLTLRTEGAYHFTIGIDAAPDEVISGEQWREYCLLPADASISNSCGTPTKSVSTRSTETLTLIQKWLHRCSSSHKQCIRRRMDNLWFPSRLIHIPIGRDVVYLIETSVKQPVGHYITLSHRWPARQPCVTSSTNYNSRTSGITVNTLPQAFRDVISICKRLRIWYLWIDSLCIIQNDRNDWLRESSLMHKVYTYSYLNISAIAALNSSKTMFARRDLSYFDERTIWTPLNGLKLGSQWNEYRIIDMDLWQGEVTDANLNRRGWVIQERLLAPRVVHFGRQEVFWECRELEASETYPNQLPLAMVFQRRSGFKILDPESSIREAKAHGRTAHEQIPREAVPYSIWGRIVNAYSKASLTKGQDKLLAVAGIAKYLSDTYLRDRYIAGLWENNLVLGLLWSTDEPGHRPKQYRAPTFSWASIDGEVLCLMPTQYEALIEVQDWKLHYATEDPYGLVTGGSLIVKCRLLRLSAKHRGWGFFDLHVNGGSAIDLLVCLDEKVKYFNPSAAQNELFCVPWAFTGGGHLDILLLELVNDTHAIYRRFGRATAMKAEEIEAIQDPPNNIGLLPAVTCEDGMQIIRLI